MIGLLVLIAVFALVIVAVRIWDRDDDGDHYVR